MPAWSRSRAVDAYLRAVMALRKAEAQAENRGALQTAVRLAYARLTGSQLAEARRIVATLETPCPQP